MITQNPITGRSRKKLAGVYARTLWGKNVIQSCPVYKKKAPSKALKDSRAAFAQITQMANMVDASLLNNIYYSAPTGRSRRHVLTSQLFAGVSRFNKKIFYNLQMITKIGSNRATTTAGILYTIESKNFTIPKSSFPSQTLADTNRVPCVLAISYDLCLCESLFDYITISGNNLIFDNVSDTLIGHEMLLVALWQTNIGTLLNPIYVFGSLDADA